MNGTQANSQLAAYGTVANMGAAIFGSIGANTYATNLRFKADDVVVQETQRDNRAMIATGATVLLFVIVAIVLLR